MKGKDVKPPDRSTKLQRKPIPIETRTDGFPLWLRATVGWLTIFPDMFLRYFLHLLFQLGCFCDFELLFISCLCKTRSSAQPFPPAK